MVKHIFTVYGSPVPQGRPKFFRRGNHVGAYDPGKSKSWKHDVKLQVLDQLRRKGDIPTTHEGPVICDMYFYLPRPKSLPAKIKHHVRRPDRDNLEKAVLDAMKGLLWRDDSQVVDGRTRKMYGEPRVVIAVQLLPMTAPVGAAFPLTDEYVSIATTTPEESPTAAGAREEG